MKDSIILQKGSSQKVAIDVLRDEYKNVNDMMRSNNNLRWASTSGLFILGLSIVAFSLQNEDLIVKVFSYLLSFLAFAILMSVNVYLEIQSLVHHYHLILIEKKINQVLRGKVLSFTKQHSRIGEHPIPGSKTIKAGLNYYRFAWTILLGSPLFGMLSTIFKDYIIACVGFSLLLAFILSSFAHSYYNRAEIQIKTLLKKKEK